MRHDADYLTRRGSRLHHPRLRSLRWCVVVCDDAMGVDKMLRRWITNWVTKDMGEGLVYRLASQGGVVVTHEGVSATMINLSDKTVEVQLWVK